MAAGCDVYVMIMTAFCATVFDEAPFYDCRNWGHHLLALSSNGARPEFFSGPTRSPPLSRQVAPSQAPPTATRAIWPVASALITSDFGNVYRSPRAQPPKTWHLAARPKIALFACGQNQDGTEPICCAGALPTMALRRRTAATASVTGYPNWEINCQASRMAPRHHCFSSISWPFCPMTRCAA